MVSFTENNKGKMEFYKLKRLRGPVRRGIALLAGFVLLFSAAVSAAEDEGELDLKDLLDLSEIETEDVKILAPGASLKATDVAWHTPSEGSPVRCSHENCYWNLPMGTADEEAVWKVLTAPVTVLNYNQRQQYKIRKEPDKNCTEYTGEVTGESQAVHVLERGEEWSLIEAYSSSTEDSKVRIFAEKFQGYVETSLLKEMEVDQTYGLVIDKQKQRMYVYKEGKVYAELLISTGFNTKGKKPWQETPAGEFLCISWTGEMRLKDDATGEVNMRCRLAIRINDGILIHEVPLSPPETEGGSWTYDKCERFLGEKASHGCIRVQRRRTPEGVNHEWLWKNLSDGTKKGKAFTKVIIWDDKDRTLNYPDDDLILYYNPSKHAQYYHSQITCESYVDKKTGEHPEMEPFRYSQLDESPYSRLKSCPYCAPEPREKTIDELNKENNR